MDWTRLRTSCRIFAGIGSDTARTSFRILRGRFGERCAGRPTRCCPDIVRTLRDLLRYNHVRGWCHQKIKAFKFQKAARDFVRLNV